MKVRVVIIREEYDLVIPDKNLEGIPENEREEFINNKVLADVSRNVSFDWKEIEHG